MINILVGEKLTLYASIWDFCGTEQQAILVHDVSINALPTLQPPRCQDISGIVVVFRLVGTSATVQCNQCSADTVYSILGTGTTNQNGMVSVTHIVNSDDLAAYNATVTAGNSLKVMACIFDAKGQTIINNNCSDTLTVHPTLAPTHIVSFKLGFVPPQLAAYFQTYIEDISNSIMNYLTYPPPPWIYVGMTYDSVNNTFDMGLYLPPTMSPDPISDLLLVVNTWTGFLGVVGTIAAIVLLIAGFPFIALFIALGSAILLVVTVKDARTNEIKAETVATNLKIQIDQTNKEQMGNSVVETAWESSPKSQADCLARLQGHIDVHSAIIKGYMDIYAKYANMVPLLTTEQNTVTSNTTAIITQFNNTPYTVPICDTFNSQILTEINASNVRLSTILEANINPTENYSVACAGWANQADCESHTCFWYDGRCHEQPACWIPNPIGGCILSASTGTIIVGTVVAIAGIGAAYWLLTRRPTETRAIATGAQQAVSGEVERARQAYARIRPPTQPTGQTTTIVPVR